MNQAIPADHEFVSKNGKKIKTPNIHDKLDEIQKIKSKDFEGQFENKFTLIKNIINFRNDIIHLKPSKEQTNTKYKDFYRFAIDFPYNEAIYAVRDFINYFEPDLIEECRCGNEYFYNIEHSTIE